MSTTIESFTVNGMIRGCDLGDAYLNTQKLKDEYGSDAHTSFKVIDKIPILYFKVNKNVKGNETTSFLQSLFGNREITFIN